MNTKKLIKWLEVLLYFDGRMAMNRILGLPAQTRKERQIFKKVFDNVTGKKQIRVFEWGSGFSTVYYANYLRKKGIEFEWHSIENSISWYEKVKLMVKKRNLETYVSLYVKEFKPFWEKPDWVTPPLCGVFSPKLENEKTYVAFPKKFKKKFDIVIVDARFRRHCIQTVKEILLPAGIVILHDAQKKHYHVGLDYFRYKKFINSGSWWPSQEVKNKVWIGSMSDNKIFEALERF
ncbi:hypothetical protein KKC91_00945 [bacterium]|nr:hypothetical protein [bacterium]